jgi:hypothetical protein
LVDMDLSPYFIPPIVIPSDVETPTDTYKYYGTEATSDKGYWNVPVRWSDDEATLFASAGIENIVYVAKSEKTSWYWDGSAYQQIGGGGGITTETDPTVPTLVKNIPVSADAATNKYLNWNGSAYVRKQIDYSEIGGTAPSSGSTTKRLLTLPVNVSTTGTTEQTLVDQTIPANTFSTNGDTGWLQMYIGFGATASTKTLRIYINGSVYHTINDPNTNRPVSFQFWLQRLTSSTATTHYIESAGTSVFAAESWTPSTAIDFTSAVQIKITMQSTVAGQFTCRFGQMQLLPG